MRGGARLLLAAGPCDPCGQLLGLERSGECAHGHHLSRAQCVAGGEDLAAQCVDHGQHALVSARTRTQRARRERTQAGDGRKLDRKRLREPARGGDAHAQPGEPSRAEAHRDPLELAPADLAVLEQTVDHAQQPRGVARMLVRGRIVARAERAAVGQLQPHDGRVRGGVETQHDQVRVTSMRRRFRPWCASTTRRRAPASSSPAC